MTTQTEALKLALDRIGNYIERRKSARGIDIESIHAFDLSVDGVFELRLSDLELIKEALAQPEQEQRCYCGDIYNLGVIHRNDGPCHYPEHTSEYKRGYADAMNWKVQNHLEHLQPQRTWVDLTDEERKTISEANNMLVDDDLFDEIEAKLKEKNT